MTFQTYQFRFLILSACGDLMYSSTICFHLLRQSQPRKKLWTFLIFAMSGSSQLSIEFFLSPSRLLCRDLDDIWGIRRHSFFRANSYKNSFRIICTFCQLFVLCNMQGFLELWTVDWIWNFCGVKMKVLYKKVFRLFEQDCGQNFKTPSSLTTELWMSKVTSTLWKKTISIRDFSIFPSKIFYLLNSDLRPMLTNITSHLLM